MPFHVALVAFCALLLTPAVASAQGRGAGLDLTLARHSVKGGFLDYRDGPLADVLVAFPIRPTPTGSILLGAGGGLVFVGFGDRCKFGPGGECAPQGNFGAVNLLVGTTIPGAGGLARAFAGPAFYAGGGGRSVGLQGRVDLTTPAFAHIGLGAMLRGTYLPDHGGDRLLAWALGGSLAFR